LNLLDETNFRRLLVGQAISSLGNNLVPVALAFAVLRITNSPSDLGLVLSVESGTQIAFLLIGGVVSDRYSRLAIMQVTDAGRGIAEVVLGLLLVVGAPSIGIIAFLGSIQGMGGALFTPASGGLVPSLVSRENLQRANAVRQSASATASIVGPAVAGVLVLTVGAGWAILIDGLSFLINVIFLLRINVDLPARSRNSSALSDLVAGWRDFWGRTWFRTTVLGSTVFNFAYGLYLVAGPVASLKLYHGPEMWAIVSVSAGVGAVVGGIIAARKMVARMSFQLCVFTLAFYALAPLATAIHSSVTVVAIGAVVGGIGVSLFGAAWQTAIQRYVPEEFLSRATSYDYFGSLVAMPIGLACGGPAVALIGVDTSLAVVGLLVVSVIVFLVLAPSVRRLSRYGEGDAFPAL
jgi:MFS family permease